MKKVVVVGAGVMGGGIAQVLAEAGLEVVVADEAFTTYPPFLKIAQEKVMLGIFWRKTAEGKESKFVYRTREAVLEVFNRIEWCELNSNAFKTALGSCDAVVEAITENIDAKKALYQTLEKYLQAEAPIFTNTSVIQIKKLAESLKNPERFMGMHFFNPVPLMKPVELILHWPPEKEKSRTNARTIVTAEELVKTLNKDKVYAPDRVGFIVNGCMVPMIIALDTEIKNGADFKKIDKSFTGGTWYDFPPARRIVEVMIKNARDILAEGQTTEGDINRLIRLGLNMPFGPFEIEKIMTEGKAGEVKFKVGPAMLCDHVGIDVALDCCKMFKFQEPDKWEIPETLEKMLAEGKRGKKSGRGFYEYKEEVTFEMAPDKSYAKIGWTGKVLSLDLVTGLKEKFEFAKAFGVKTIILAINRGRGADITEFSLCLVDQESADLAINTWHSTIQTIVDYPGQVIAAVEGTALGGAYEFALGCDYIVAGKGALAHILKNLKKYSALRKRNRDPMVYSLADLGRAMRETSEAELYWRNEKKEDPPQAFYLAKKAIVEGNKKSLTLGLIDEWKAITASFGTETAQTKVRAFLEGERLINPPKGTTVGLPELTLGILPGGGGTQNLARRVGLAKTLRMILRGEVVVAEPPYVDEVVGEKDSKKEE